MWILLGMFVVLVPAFLAIAYDIDFYISFGAILMAPFLYFAREKPDKRVKTISPPHPRIKKDTSYIRKHNELSLGGKLKELVGAILMIILAPFGLVSFAFAIFFFLMLLHYLVVMPLLDKFAG